MFFILSACSTLKTTLLEGENVHIIHATASSEHEAMKGAKKESQTFCQGMGKRAKIVDAKATYQGMDKTAKAIGHAINWSSSNVYVPVDRTDDNKVILKFRCR